MNTRDEFSNVSATVACRWRADLKCLHTGAGWAWSTHAASLLPAPDSMHAGLPAATADGQRVQECVGDGCVGDESRSELETVNK